MFCYSFKHLPVFISNSYNSFFFQRVLSHQDDTALLKAYIVEWRKFFTQCDILPKPFCQLEITLMGKQGSNKKSTVEDSIVRKVSLFLLFVPLTSLQKEGYFTTLGSNLDFKWAFLLHV